MNAIIEHVRNEKGFSKISVSPTILNNQMSLDHFSQSFLE